MSSTNSPTLGNRTAIKKPRVVRGVPPHPIRRKHYREDSLPSLLRDFLRRCAYCMNRESEDEGFKIDHFWPTSKGGSFTDYLNLFLSCDRCNHHKWDHWPTRAERNLGIRFLNCCEETDYGDHIFERENGELYSETPEGRYHIRMIFLNRPDLVRLRQKRRQFLAIVNAPVTGMNFGSEVEAKLAVLSKLLKELIPAIPRESTNS